MCSHYRNDLRKLRYNGAGPAVADTPRTDGLYEDVWPAQEALVSWRAGNGVCTWTVMRWGFRPVTARVLTNARNLSSADWRPWLSPCTAASSPRAPSQKGVRARRRSSDGLNGPMAGRSGSPACAPMGRITRPAFRQCHGRTKPFRHPYLSTQRDRRTLQSRGDAGDPGGGRDHRVARGALWPCRVPATPPAP